MHFLPALGEFFAHLRGEASHPDVTLEYLASGNMRLRAPQVTVDYILTTPPLISNTVGNFDLKFYLPGDTATQIPFVIYSVALDWVPTGNAVYYQTATVTKTMGGATYQTAVKCNSGSSFEIVRAVAFDASACAKRSIGLGGDRG